MAGVCAASVLVWQGGVGLLVMSWGDAYAGLFRVFVKHGMLRRVP